MVCLCLLQAVACSLYVVGFGESIAGLLGQEDNIWVPRGIGAIVILALLGELRDVCACTVTPWGFRAASIYVYFCCRSLCDV